ncbi:uncharacterized protein LOC111518782 isoform X1 [Drosophila willistoni]|uniref:uncharacterized protein LOC111518782 isoform X1 n=1 Tax=Drosophila willistoni TaxID=7260 RepID=UPI001F088754|nr:uncharacterized protein LOC111518782 isoform X1 [Drosophila willistoni]
MNTILYCLSFGLIVVAKALGSEYRIPFKGQCPQIIPLPIKLSHTTAFMGNWYQYAVHPDYLQDKCIRRQFHGLEAWKHLAHTDNDKFIIQYYCYEHTIRHKGRQHLRSISIFVKEREPTPTTIATITNALKRHFKFPMHLLNHTDNTFCTEFELKEAMLRA